MKQRRYLHALRAIAFVGLFAIFAALFADDVLARVGGGQSYGGGSSGGGGGDGGGLGALIYWWSGFCCG